MKSLYSTRAAARRMAIVFVCAFQLITSLSADNYYWVNGSGDWSDFAGHWAKIPNPTLPAHYHANIPTDTSDVHFGANGGVAYTVNVNGAFTVPKCRNMDWTASPAGAELGGSGGRLDIYGSVVLKNGMLFTYSGEVHFIAFGATSTILSDGVHFPGAVFFEGTGGGWQLADEFYGASWVIHEGGLLETLGNTVTVGYIFRGNYSGGTGQLVLGDSEFNIFGGAEFRYSAAQFNAGTSHIKMYGDDVYLEGPVQFAYPIHFFDVSFMGSCITSGGFRWGNIDGTLTFHNIGRIHSYSTGSIPVLKHVVFLGDGFIYNANNYNHLTFTAGKTYTIQDNTAVNAVNGAVPTGTDQTILLGGSFTAMGFGTCSQFINIKSGQYGTAVKFVNNSGADIMVGCVILEDIHADGAHALINDDGIDLGNTTGWIFVNPHGAMDLYWVGGAGDWDDPCHWTTDPLSIVGDCDCIPNAATNVYFTANSGFSPDPLDLESINTPADAAFIACRDMDWTAVTGVPTFHSVYNGILTSEQYIYGSLSYSPHMVQDFLGTTRFRTIGTCSLLNAGQTFKDLVVFEGTGELSFLDAFNYSNWAPYYYDVYHLRGTIKTLGNSITLGTNNGWQGNKDLNNNFVDQGAELWLGEVGGNSSTVSFGGNVAFVAGYEAGKFHAVQSHIKPEGPGTATVTAENRPHDFWNVSFINNFVGIFYGGILNKLTYDGTLGIVENSTPNRLIHEMEMKDDGEIRGNQTFDIMTLTGGNVYTLQNGTVQTITSAFNTTSDCEHYVTLTSGYPDKTAEIKKEGGGTLTINNVVLDNITADLSTGATYTALNGIALGTTTGWSVLNPPARTLYWVGGNGDWNSAAHWSLASGGAGGECPPTPLDNVFFNGVSGLDAANVVTISQLHTHCKDMDWTGVGNGTKLTGYSYLNIYGNLTFSAGMDYENYYATYFRAQQPVTITSAGNKYYYVYFWSPTGEWTLMDDFETVQDVDVYHYYGTLRSNNHTIGVGRIWWGATPYYLVPDYTTNPTAKLFLGSSKVKIYPTAVWAGEFIVSYPAANFAAGTSEIIFESGVYSTLYSADPDLKFYDGTFKEKDGRFYNSSVLGKLLFEKSCFLSGVPGQYVHEVEFKDDAIFYGTLNFHIMTFAPGKRYTFTEGTTQTLVPHNGIEGQFIAQGLPGQYIEMKSSDPNTPAVIHKDDYDGTSTCTKYLFLTGMTHTGTEDIYVPTPGGDVFNNSGWQFFPCNPCPATIPVLDVANSITTGCPPGQAKLVLAGLKPDEWAIWYSDPAATTNIVYNGGQVGPMGNMFMPVITGPVTYYARVYSDGGLCESTVVLAVDITITSPPAAFNVTGGGLVCSGSNGTPVGLAGSVAGVSYQLQLDGSDTGSPLAGTGAALDFGLQTAAGTYTVVATTDGTACSAAMSGSAVVTGSQNQAPVVAASSNAPLCTGSADLLLFESGGAATTWNWSGPGGFASTDQNPVLANASPANSGTYMVVVSDGSGCTNVGSVGVLVHPVPTMETPVNLLHCASDVIDLNYLTDDPFTFYTGTIDNPNLGITFYGTSVLRNDDLMPAVANLSVTPAHHYNGLTCFGITHYFTLTVLPYPQANYPGDQMFCAGETTTTIPLTGPVPGAYYTWTNNNPAIGLAAAGTGDIPAFMATNPGQTPLTANIVVRAHYDYNGLSCTDTIPTYFTITVKPDSALLFTLLLDSVSVDCQSLGQQVSVNVSVRNIADIIGAQFSVEWDENVLQFESVTNGYPGLNLTPANFLGFASTTSGVLHFFGSNPGVGWPDIPDNGTFFTINFTVLSSPSSSPIEFLGPIDAVNGLFNQVPVVTEDGNFVSTDIEPPTLSCPPDVVLSATPGTCSAEFSFSLSAVADACDAAPTIMSSHAPSGTIFQPGITVVTFVAVDQAGNSSSCSFTVTVIVTEVIDFMVLAAPPSCNGATDGSLEITNVTGGQAPYQYALNGGGFQNNPVFGGLGVGSYTLQVQDAGGCIVAEQQVMLPQGPDLPLAIQCPTNIPALTANSSCRAFLGDYTGLATLSGGCDIPVNPIVQTPPPGTVVNPGTVAITLTVSNTAGQSAMCVFNVTVSGGCGGH